MDNIYEYMKSAIGVSSNSTCLKRKVGAVLVKDQKILTTATNGAPEGTKTCKELGCLRDLYKIKSGENYEFCRAVHAEQNILIQCALRGISPSGAIFYCTLSPCIICAKMLVKPI